MLAARRRRISGRRWCRDLGGRYAAVAGEWHQQHQSSHVRRLGRAARGRGAGRLLHSGPARGANESCARVTRRLNHSDTVFGMRSRIRTRAVSVLMLFLLLWSAGHPAAQARRPQRPRLVLLVAIDQFRYDYLTRFRDAYTGGLRRLLDRGAVFTNAYLEHYPTVTAVGHSTMLSGATPALSGIIGNDWYDREAGKQVTSVSDDDTKLLGAPGATGMSPRRLLVSTLGDEMKRGVSRDTKVIGISLKDRSAVLPVGRAANAAYWYDDSTGAFVSSTYYFPELPKWVTAFNSEQHIQAYAGKTWLDAADGKPA